MAKKSTSKKISVNAFEKAYKEAATHEASTTIEWGGLEVVVRHTLELVEMLKYVEEVASGCFVGDDSKYVPEIRGFLNSAAIINYYTNITLPESASRQYEMLCNSHSLINKICEVINREQYINIQEAIDNRLNNYNSVATSIALHQLETINVAIESLESKFAEIFGGINRDDLKAMVAAIGENGFSEEAMVKAVLERRGDAIGESSLE